MTGEEPEWTADALGAPGKYCSVPEGTTKAPGVVPKIQMPAVVWGGPVGPIAGPAGGAALAQAWPSCRCASPRIGVQDSAAPRAEAGGAAGVPLLDAPRRTGAHESVRIRARGQGGAAGVPRLCAPERTRAHRSAGTGGSGGGGRGCPPACPPLPPGAHLRQCRRCARTNRRFVRAATEGSLPDRRGRRLRRRSPPWHPGAHRHPAGLSGEVPQIEALICNNVADEPPTPVRFSARNS
jgi:hypothetical protein